MLFAFLTVCSAELVRTARVIDEGGAASFEQSDLSPRGAQSDVYLPPSNGHELRAVQSAPDLRDEMNARRAADFLIDLEQAQDPRKCHKGARGQPEVAEDVPDSDGEDESLVEADGASFLEAEAEAEADADADAEAMAGVQMLHVQCRKQTRMQGMRKDATPFTWRDYKAKFSHGGNPLKSETRHFYDEPVSECRDENTNVVWLYPSHDHNGAFDIDRSVCGRLLGWYEEACSVHVWRIGSVQQATKVLNEYKHNALQFVAIGGHGADDEPEMQWGASETCGKGVLCGNRSPTSKRFLRSTLKNKMVDHGTILLDSCYGHASGMAGFIADNVGKGVKVIGGDNSFGAVTVGRFGPGYIVTKLDGARVKEIIAEDRKCPRGRPNSKGDCECPAGTQCTTERGDKCPRSNGLFSRKFFDPGCASYGTCACKKRT